MKIAPVQLQEAQSFPESTPPNQAVEVHRIQNGNHIFIYYKDSEGNLYYNTESGLKIAKELEEAQRKYRKEKMSQPAATG